MSDCSWSVSETIQRLDSMDSNFNRIYLGGNHFSDDDISELVDQLLAHPNILTRIYLDINRLTDKTGIKLARYVATSSTIQKLCLSYNQFGPKTLMAMAWALRFNTSLQVLELCRYESDETEFMFIDALRINPNRPSNSIWQIYSYADFERLKEVAEQMGHPSLQSLLATKLYNKND